MIPEYIPFMVQTELTFPRRRRTYIDASSYRPGRLVGSEPWTSGSVEVTLDDGTHRVPAYLHDDGSIETEEVIHAEFPFAVEQRLGALVLSPGRREIAVIWWPCNKAPLGRTRTRLTLAQSGLTSHTGMEG
ncbi:hypothetical protein Rumeso_03125 [Rubellimicrobium mesophilum DSM 19309]|uniref:Uncharacterized protein n=1 Tax=Rubellimicrobium mesophilum DSM 19309 TaxID=442562 RepID=A0A017HLR2_9RHOB|nr:hypothetical protein [Rubellimicrobium mesophilum]EYD75301.1 hypothetical protein Rumeso_03125 [Rubellimicrobium mesophilum DSM 19309]